jgi:hypothetical protein
MVVKSTAIIASTGNDEVTMTVSAAALRGAPSPEKFQKSTFLLWRGGT